MTEKKRILEPEEFEVIVHQAMIFEAAYGLVPVSLKDEQAKVDAAASIAKAAREELRLRRRGIVLEKAKPLSDAAKKEPAYDPANRVWLHCPECGSADITYESASGAPYQACFQCRLWLNSNGTTSRMSDR